MRIIKEGQIIRFECEACGCVFEEGLSKTIDVGFYRSCNCPCCGEEVKYFENPASAIIGLAMPEKTNQRLCEVVNK